MKLPQNEVDNLRIDVKSAREDYDAAVNELRSAAGDLREVQRELRLAQFRVDQALEAAREMREEWKDMVKYAESAGVQSAEGEYKIFLHEEGI